MSSDQRWTGGTANREWQRGTRHDPPPDLNTIRSLVRNYLADCASYRDLLNPRYHPTEDGALKVIYHQGPDQETAVRAIFREETEP